MKGLNIKKIVFFGFLLIISFVFSSSNVNAATQSCSNSNQIIFSLYDDRNSHGAVATGGAASGADYKICYEKIFSGQYAGANPNECKAGDTNNVLRLSADSNAHAQIFSKNYYTTKICYGDLICRATTGSCDTTNPDPAKREAPIVYLSSDSNAHIGAPSVSSAYQWKICCTSPSNPPTGNNPPSVIITSPADGARFTAPATISLKATATDSDGSITKVEFFNGATSIGIGTSGAGGVYSFDWSIVPTGTYTLTAKATDDDGAITTSAPITIYIQTSPPPGACNKNGIREGNEQCDAGPNGGFSDICPTKQCQSDCNCDNLAMSCQENFDERGICNDPTSDAYNREPICNDLKEKALGEMTADQRQCYEPRCECYVHGINKCDVRLKEQAQLKNNAPAFCIGGGIIPPVFKKCEVDSTQLGECVEGYRTVTVGYSSGSDSSCPTAKKIPCGRNVAFLPFIGILQIIAAIIIIGVIYYLISSRKKKEKKVKGKR